MSTGKIPNLKDAAAGWNMIPNLIWTALFLLPVYIYCQSRMPLKPALTMLALSLIPLFLPNSFFTMIQLSKRPAFYECLGIRFINIFAQNGTLINRRLRKKYPQLKAAAATRTSMRKVYHQTFLFEKFHFSLFLFTTAITAFSVARHQLVWAVTLCVCNLFYNIFPNLLQQYIRAKLNPLMQ